MISKDHRTKSLFKDRQHKLRQSIDPTVDGRVATRKMMSNQAEDTGRPAYDVVCEAGRRQEALLSIVSTDGCEFEQKYRFIHE